MSIFTSEHRLFQQSIRRFAEREILPHVNAWEAAKSFPSEIFLKLGSAGFLGTLIAEDLGGSGGDYALAAAWCEEFGRIPSVGFTTGVNMHALVCLPAIARFGTEEAKQKIIPRALSGETIAAYAFTEPGAGSDLSQAQTSAKRDGDGYRLTGSKIFITNGERAGVVIVLAKTDSAKGYDGFSTFIVDTKSEGFSVSRTLSKLGWYASDTAELVFDNVFVPQSMLLGKEGEGWPQAMQSLEWERLMLSLAALGGASKCFEDTVRYVNDRKVFGQTVGSIDSNQETLLSLWSRLEAGRAQCHRAVQMLLDGKRCRREVSLTKISVTELAIEVADACLQLHGGYGYTTEFSPERWLRDLRLNTIGGGTSQVLAKVAAAELFPSAKKLPGQQKGQ